MWMWMMRIGYQEAVKRSFYGRNQCYVMPEMRWKTNHRKENRATEGEGPPCTSVGDLTVHRPNHSLAAMTIGSSDLHFSFVASCWIVLKRGICHSMHLLDHFFSQVSLIHKALKTSSILGLFSLTLDTHLKQAKPKYNRRNKGDNLIIKHINSLNWLQNT